MSLLTELFGPDVLLENLETVKDLINSLPPTLREKKDILLKEYASIKGVNLTKTDFNDILGHA